MAIGETGASLIISRYQALGMYATDGKVSDAWVTALTVPAELKADTYDTGNFFGETQSSIESRTIGGPLRAVRDRIPLYIYYFFKSGKCYWFDSRTILQYLNIYKAANPQSRVLVPNKRNRSWHTEGYKIPIIGLAPLAIAIHDLNSEIPPADLLPIFKWASINAAQFKQPRHLPKAL